MVLERRRSNETRGKSDGHRPWCCNRGGLSCRAVLHPAKAGTLKRLSAGPGGPAKAVFGSAKAGAPPERGEEEVSYENAVCGAPT